MSWATRAISALIPCMALLLSCAPPAAVDSTAGQAAASHPSEAQARPKILTIGSLSKAATIDGYTGEGGTRSGADMLPLLNDLLTVIDPAGRVLPQLAVEVPSLEKGSWEIRSDGRMVMTWKLRQGVKWHDGAPFTSDDLMFSFELHKDPELAHAQIPIARLMESAATPDPYTFVVTWRSIYVNADQAPALAPNAKHHLDELYRSDKQAFINSARFRDEYVGLGPYKMAAWDGGVQMELVRNEAYWQGRPPLDRVIIRMITDTNAVVAQILAEAMDVIMPAAVSPEAALEVRRRWEGTGHVTRIEPVSTLDYLMPMLRPEYAVPQNGMTQLPVRQAMMHGIDRKALADVITAGMGTVADSHWFPEDALFSQVESAAAKYPYDLTRARQLLAQAGWEPGPDGILVHRPSGERYETELRINQTLSVKSGDIIADEWKKLGIASTPSPIPPARAADRQYVAQHPGPYVTYSFGDWSSDRLNSREIAAESNRWSGRNLTGYVNPRADQVLDLLLQTVDPVQRLPLLREQVQIYTSDLALMPLYWEVRTVLALKSVKAEIRPGLPWWNPLSWDKETS
jgi:peptide/nickel transport system substrate-binding protein